MNLSKKLLLLSLLCPFFAYAQKYQLVNSGEVIKKSLTLYDSAKYKPALIELNTISRSDTNYVYSLYLKALNCEADSQFKQAVSYCKEGLALQEQREYEPDLYNTYGNTLNDMQNHDGAIHVFDEAINKYPASALLYFNKGIVYMGMNKPAEAEIWFKKALIINPYMYSAHFKLAVTALLQGKIVPATLGLMGYLMVSPEGRYSSNAIKLLSEISNANDAITDLKTKRTTEPGEDYETVEEIVLSRIALDKAYKPVISLDDPISRQIQVIFEKLSYQPDDNDFWMQYYFPFYKRMFNSGKFELFINHIFSSANVAVIKDYNKKNRKALDQFVQEAANYLDTIRYTRELFYKRRDTVAIKYIYNDKGLTGIGKLTPSGKDATGPWVSYYQYGNIKARGIFNEKGEREGDWLYYFYSGKLKSKEHYVGGKLQGDQQYYHEDGNLSSKEHYENGLAEGPIYTYYFTGGLKSVTNYLHDKQSGVKKSYYFGGPLNAIENYTNGQLDGLYTAYYKNGNKRVVANYVNGKLNGNYKMYYETGELNYEGNYIADKAQGEWKYYHTNGKPKEKRNYVNDDETGLHEEYYETGELSLSCNFAKGKITGELTEFYKDGKPFKKSQYDNGAVQSVTFFDKSGKVLSASIPVNGLLSVVSYTTDGVKKAHYFYDKKGNLTGPDTIFFPSGKISQLNQYKNDEFDGLSVTYYANGKIKNQVEMVEGKDNGHITTYYANGKVNADGWRENDEDAGPWYFYDDRGRLITSSYYMDGEINGFKETFNPAGVKLSEEKYDGGVLEKVTEYGDSGNIIQVDSFPQYSGKYKLIYANGKTMTETNYVNGNFDGVYKEYYFDGNPMRTFYYKNGMLDSTYTSYYYGAIKSNEGKYKFNNRTGVWKNFDDQGNVENEITYANDMMNGLRTDYSNKTVERVSNYKDDKLEGDMKKYDPDGSLAFVVNFSEDNPQHYSYMGKDGKMVADIPIASTSGPLKAYFANGKISREWAYDDNMKNGQDIMYYSNGQVRSVDTVAYEVSEGTSKEFSPDGKPRYEYHYDDDSLNGVCKDYWKNGNLKEEGVFDNGNYNGPVKQYDENGKLIKTLNYKYGVLVSVQIEK